MVALKYTTEIKKSYVQRYLDEKWESRNKFSIANNINQSLFNTWCLEYEKELRGKPTFAKVNVLETIQTERVSPESKQTEEPNLSFCITYGKFFDLNINIPSKYLKDIFGGSK